MIGWIYFFIIIFANTIGAVSGMGGGVIIKPVFDVIGAHSVGSISFYSSIAVFTMAIVSTLRQIRNGIEIKWSVAGWISAGAVTGGMIGNGIFEWLLKVMNNDGMVQMTQIILTITTLIISLLYTRYKWKSLELKNMPLFFLSGLILGSLATLLGIGGGPINVALLMYCFNISIKEATVYSIITILFSQFSKIATIGMTTGFFKFDLSVLIYIIPAAIIGGFLGATLSGKLSQSKVTILYQIIVLGVLFINISNGWRLII